MTNELKVSLIALTGIGAICATMIFSRSMTAKQEEKKHELDRQTELEIAQIKKSYPPEYWTAQAAEAAANAEVKKARIESDERLELDRRTREDAEIIRKREFEKNAPAEYWEQKRIEEEEKTKREADKRRYEAELEATKLHSKALEESAKVAERAIRNSVGISKNYNGLSSDSYSYPWC